MMRRPRQAFTSSSQQNSTSPHLHRPRRRPIQAADAYYARGANWLRENTRNTKKFDVLFNENVNYGFRRNLFGLKLPGFLLNTLIVLVCLVIFWRRWPVDLSNGFDAKLLGVIVIAILHAAYLALFVTEEGVFEAARIYARQLLLSTQSPHLNKPAKLAPPAPRKNAGPPRAPAASKVE